MPNVRPLNRKKYGISKHAFMTAYAYCLQYPEWREALENMGSLIGSPSFDSTSGGSGDGDTTARLAERRIELESKIMNVENAVRMATEKEPAMYEYLLEYVTTEGSSFQWMKSKGIPCERTYFYEIRRYFYWIMAKKI